MKSGDIYWVKINNILCPYAASELKGEFSLQYTLMFMNNGCVLMLISNNSWIEVRVVFLINLFIFLGGWGQGSCSGSGFNRCISCSYQYFHVQSEIRGYRQFWKLSLIVVVKK